MGSENFHERYEDLTEYTRDLHRGIVSLMEELEAIDWYQQRIDATADDSLKAVLAHNRDEEIEHAIMNLEWIRRRNPTFDAAMKLYLFSEGPITTIEEESKAQGGAVVPEPGGGDATGATGSSGTDGCLDIGSLKLT